MSPEQRQGVTRDFGVTLRGTSARRAKCRFIPDWPRRPGDAEAPAVVQTDGAGRSVQRRPKARTRPQPGRASRAAARQRPYRSRHRPAPAGHAMPFRQRCVQATPGAARAASSGSGCDRGRANASPKYEVLGNAFARTGRQGRGSAAYHSRQETPRCPAGSECYWWGCLSQIWQRLTARIMSLKSSGRKLLRTIREPL